MMYHPQQAYGLGGLGQHPQQPTSPGPQEDQSGGQGVDGIRGHADINTILDQIMNITDQSLDEAQVLFFHFDFVNQPEPHLCFLPV